MFRVVGIVVYGGHRSELVEAPSEHTFGVEVGEAERANHLVHALRLAVLLDGIQQCAAHVDVVDEVNPAEAHALPAPPLVGLVVDDGRHASGHAAVAVESHEIFRLAKLEGGVPLLVECLHLVAEEVGHVLLATVVQVVVEVYETGKFPFAFHPFYRY